MGFDVGRSFAPQKDWPLKGAKKVAALHARLPWVKYPMRPQIYGQFTSPYAQPV